MPRPFSDPARPRRGHGGGSPARGRGAQPGAGDGRKGADRGKLGGREGRPRPPGAPLPGRTGRPAAAGGPRGSKRGDAGGLRGRSSGAGDKPAPNDRGRRDWPAPTASRREGPVRGPRQEGGSGPSSGRRPGASQDARRRSADGGQPRPDRPT